MTRYSNSKSELSRVKQIIPLASQTFSKAFNRFPSESPNFLSHGKGGRVWDIDGNEYVDLVSGLLPVVLGYCDPDVDAAIAEQLKRGISFSLPTLLEAELADRLIEFVPCAEMARFGKNGSDVTSAAVRLARAVTGRDHVVMCGYHGWQDWSIGTADNLANRAGVPFAVRNLTTQVLAHPDQFSPSYGDTPYIKYESMWEKPAAIIVDCSRITEKDAKMLREIATRVGAILIFDEIISGFRWDIGGAQSIWGVIPDLACFSKAMGNGMPISAIVGKEKLMKNFDHVFFSGTFGGETLSIAAAIACIDKIDREDVCHALELKGRYLKSHFGESKHVWLTGHPAFQQLHFATPDVVREQYLTSMLAHGVLVNTSLNVCFAHEGPELMQVIDAHHIALKEVECRLAA